ncbi:MAG: DUF4342 domain-containing protein [Ruminococcaceae bacterium]|nr:DUF4342 domain-containing protein [Oscillospiraceae bacterium]
MEITLEMIDQVRERTGVTYESAKKALEENNGNVVDAIIAIEKDQGSGTDEILEKIKGAVKKGNVTRIRMLRGDEEVANIPVNAGIAGGVLGLMAGPAVLVPAVIAGAIAKFGFNCRFEIIKEDGTVEEIAGGNDDKGENE